jgi:hypothetical protein
VVPGAPDDDEHATATMANKGNQVLCANEPITARH